MVRYDNEIITIQADRKVRDNANDAAILFDFDGEEIWLPRSQIEIVDLEIDIPLWLATEKGIESYLI